MEPNTDQIWSKQKHIHVGNHARNNNLASIHFNFHLKFTILSKWILIQNRNLRIKIYCKYVIDANKH
jgi:hypothetical protein